MLIKLIYPLFYFFIISFGFAQNSIVLPQTIHENEEITVYSIKDSIHIDSDSLFFHLDVFTQDMEYIKGYVPIINGKAKFIVPSNAALVMGYFYSLDDRDDITYIRRVHNKDGKEVRNAYQHAYECYMTKEALESELDNHPNNLMAYASHASYLSERVYLGKISDTVFYKQIEKFIEKVSRKADENKPSDLAALASLYAYNKEFEKSEKTLYKILNNHPNSSFISRALSSYISACSSRKNYSDDIFLNPFIELVGKYNPQSPIGRSNMHGLYSDNKWIRRGYYKDEDIIINNNYLFNNIDSTSEYFLGANVEAYLNQKDYDKARGLSRFILEEAKKGKWLHDVPVRKEDRKVLFTKDLNTSIAFSYSSLRNIESEAQNFEAALSYTDSALYYLDRSEKKKSLIYFLPFQLEKKATLQKKLNRPYEAIKTYENLYNETKTDKVLDSIKVLFQETQQKEGFESYIENLKKQAENKDMTSATLAADFSIQDMSSNEIKLSDLKGQVVVLNFWANYCYPCALEIPFLNQLWKETKTDKITFLAATKNTPLEVNRFASRQKEMFAFSVLPNAQKLINAYDAGLVPTTVVISKTGEIIYQESGFSGNIDKLRKVVLEELKK